MSTANFDPRDRLSTITDEDAAHPLNRLRYMARSGGYVMVRRPRAVPFVLTEKAWAKLPLYVEPDQ